MSNFWKIFISVVVTFLVVGGGIYYLMQRQINSIQNSNQAKMDDLNKQIATLKSTSTTPTTTTPATTTTPTTTTSWKNYSNTKYGFSLTLNDLWKDYQIAEVASGSSTSVADLYVCIPTTSTTWKDQKAGMFCPFAITVATLAQKAGLEQPDSLNPTYIAQNSSYAFFYFTAQDRPTDGVNAMNDLKNIVATFKATK